MNIFRVFGFTMMIVGVILLFLGVFATQSAGEVVADKITGHYTNTTMWYIIGGIILIGGGIGLTRIKK